MTFYLWCVTDQRLVCLLPVQNRYTLKKKMYREAFIQQMKFMVQDLSESWWNINRFWVSSQHRRPQGLLLGWTSSQVGGKEKRLRRVCNDDLGGEGRVDVALFSDCRVPETQCWVPCMWCRDQCCRLCRSACLILILILIINYTCHQHAYLTYLGYHHLIFLIMWVHMC